MAIDEAIFRENQRRRESLPTLRFYSWHKPAVSIGYFQDASREIDCKTCREQGVEIVRRPTGGKAVYHEHDVTYAVVAQESCPPFPRDILGTYRVISGCIARGLTILGIETSMSPERRPIQAGNRSASCFSSSSSYELLAGNRKLCGSAQVRARGVFLQHGSLLTEFDPHKTCRVLFPHCKDKAGQIERLRTSITSLKDHLRVHVDVEGICSALQAGFEGELKVTLMPGELTAEEEEIASELLRDKYSMDKWNMEGVCTLD
jgi:lipoate-protein ligase A